MATTATEPTAPSEPPSTSRNLIFFPGPSSFQPHSPPSQPQIPPEPPTPKPQPPSKPFLRNRPQVRVTTEFDSDSSVFFNRVSSKLLSGLAKLKFSFQNNHRGEVADPQLALITKYLAVHYDVQDRNALVKGSLDVGPNLKLSAAHDVKAKQGKVTLVGNLSDPGYKFELTSTVPSVGLPKATLKFPSGEVSVEEKEDDEVKKILSVDGIVKGSLLNGVCTALYKDENLNLRYAYKDNEMSFIPSVSLPSNAVSFAFKRRFSPSDKLSYWYNFDTNYWSTVYKHTVGKDYKFKAGYDSEVRLGWASLWVGDEAGKAKVAPMKMKVQFMLQVPQDDVKSSVLMFRVKKRWDI